MGKVYKQSIYAGLLTVVGILLGLVVQVLSMRFFPQSEFGFTQNLIRVTSLSAQTGLLGFQVSLLIKGQSYPRNSSERNVFFTYVLSVSVLGLLLTSGVFILFSNTFISAYHIEDQSLIKDYFYLFPILTFGSGILLFLEAWLQGETKASIATFSKEVLTRIAYILLIGCYASGLIGFKYFIISYVAIHSVPLTYLLWKGHATEQVNLRFDFKTISSSTRKHLWSFSGFHLMATLSLMLIHQLDILLIGPLSKNGLKDVAIYSVAALVVNMLRAPLRAIASAITPSLSKHYHFNNTTDLFRIFTRSKLNALIFGVFSCGLIFINLEHLNFFIYFIQSGYEAVPYIIGILLIGQLFEIMAAFSHELIGVSKGYKFNFWIALFSLTCLILLHLVLIPQWGIYGAAIATSIGFIIFNLTKSWYIYQNFGIQLLDKKGAVILLSSICLTALLYFTPNFGSDLIMVIIKSLVFIILFWWWMYKIKASNELQQITHKIFRIQS